jgi:hypothetical protein
MLSVCVCVCVCVLCVYVCVLLPTGVPGEVVPVTAVFVPAGGPTAAVVLTQDVQVGADGSASYSFRA